MHIAIENLPLIFLFIIGIGVMVIVISVIRLAGLHDETQDYYVAKNEGVQKEDATHLEELFSYFLEEEEKKNDAFRQLVLEQSQAMNDNDSKSQNVKSKKMLMNTKDQMDQNTFNEIIKRYEQGEDPQSIAKSLRKGIGEVKLILSLYSMR